MAKLKAPLFSFGASGKLADSLVYTPWKGLNNVRQYVVPANPNTQAQQDHRALLTAAVAEIHAAMIYPTYPLLASDKAAYALAGSLHPTPRTWFNEAIKIMVDAQVDAQDFACFTSVTSTYLAPTTATVDVNLVGKAAETGFIKYGTSKTALLNSVACNITAHAGTCTLTGLTVGVIYYFQWQGTPVIGKTVNKSGIYFYKHEP